MGTRLGARPTCPRLATVQRHSCPNRIPPRTSPLRLYDLGRSGTPGPSLPLNETDGASGCQISWRRRRLSSQALRDPLRRRDSVACAPWPAVKAECGCCSAAGAAGVPLAVATRTVPSQAGTWRRAHVASLPFHCGCAGGGGSVALALRLGWSGSLATRTRVIGREASRSVRRRCVGGTGGQSGAWLANN